MTERQTANFGSWFKGFLQRPMKWPWSGFVPVIDDAGKPVEGICKRFDVDGSYMTLRLAEMHLRNAGELWVDYVPLCVSVADYYYSGETRSLPFIVSHEKLRQALALVSQRTDPLLIQMLDTHLVGPVPILHEEVALFTGLFRMKRADRLDILLDVLGELGEKTGVAALAAGVPIAKAAYDGLGRLLGMDDVEYRFGSRRGLTGGDSLAEQLSSGFMAFTESLQLDTWRSLRVCGNRLVRCVDGVVKPVRELDYCLVAIEHSPKLGSFVNLPFHKLWLALVPKLFENPESGWQKDWTALVTAIRTSPDLIRSDKAAAMVSYLELRNEELAAAKGEASQATYRGNGAPQGAIRILENAMMSGEAKSEVRHRGRAQRKPEARQVSDPGDVDLVAQHLLANYGHPLPDPELVADELLKDLRFN